MEEILLCFVEHCICFIILLPYMLFEHPGHMYRGFGSIFSDWGMTGNLHQSVECQPCIEQTIGHSEITICFEGGDKSCLLLILSTKPDLVIP
jgi:hypothetical protein